MENYKITRREPPTSPAQLRAEHPLVRGLVALFVPALSERNFVGTVSGTVPQSGIAPTQNGLGGQFTGQVSTDSAFLTTDWSFVASFQTGTVGGTTSRYVVARGDIGGTDSAGFGFAAFHTSASYSGAVHVAGTYDIIGKPTGGALADNTAYIIGASQSGSSGAVYSAGVKTATASGLGTPYTGGWLEFGAATSGLSQIQTPIAWEFYAQWNRQLSDEEQALAASPEFWDILEPLLLDIPTATTAVTGSFSVTANNDTLVASGTVGNGVSGTFSATEFADTLAASGTTTIIGTAAILAQNDTLAAIGTTTILGVASVQAGSDGLVASGTSGTSTFTFPPCAIYVGGNIAIGTNGQPIVIIFA